LRLHCGDIWGCSDGEAEGTVYGTNPALGNGTAFPAKGNNGRGISEVCDAADAKILVVEGSIGHLGGKFSLCLLHNRQDPWHAIVVAEC